MPELTGDQVNDAHTRLRNFLRLVYELLRRLATTGRDPRDGLLFLEEVRPLIEAAWIDFESDFDLEASYERINKLGPSELRSHGLYGRQLDLKLRVTDIWNDAFRRMGGGRLLKRLIQAIDTLLKSLLGATGIDKAVEELKDVMADSLPED